MWGCARVFSVPARVSVVNPKRALHSWVVCLSILLSSLRVPRFLTFLHHEPLDVSPRLPSPLLFSPDALDH